MLRSASDMRQQIKMQEYGKTPEVKKVMNMIEDASKDYKTAVSDWFTRGEAKNIDLVFTSLGYSVTYVSYDQVKDRFWMSINW